MATITGVTTAIEHTAILERCALECTQRGWRLAWSLLRDEQDASDVVQQAFLVAVRKPGRIPQEDPWPWLASAIALEARNVMRKRGRRRTITHDFGDSSMPIPDRAEGDPLAQAQAREQTTRLLRALDELPDDEREAIWLTAGSGLSYSAAARALHLPVTTLRLRVQRAVEALRKKLGGTEAGIMGSLPLLQVPEPPPALHASLQAQVSGGVVPGAITIGSIAVKKAYLLWIAAFLLLVGAGATIAYFGIAPSAGSGAASGERDKTARMNARAVDEHVQDASVGPRKRPESSTTDRAAAESADGHEDTTSNPEAQEDSIAAQPADAGVEMRSRQRQEPEPEVKPLAGAIEDPRVIATIGGASAWTAQKPPVAMVAHPDDSSLFTISDTIVTRWDAHNGRPVWAAQFERTTLRAIDLSPDGTTLAVGGWASWVTLLDSTTGGRKGAIGLPHGVSALRFRPDGLTMAVGASDIVQLVEIATGRVRGRYSLAGESDLMQGIRRGDISNVSFTRDGRTLLAAYQYSSFRSSITDGIVGMWDVESGRRTLRLDLQSLGMTACGNVCFCGDGARVLVPAMDAGRVILSDEEYMERNPVGYSYKPDESPEAIKERSDRASKKQADDYRSYLQSKGGKPNSGTLQRHVAIVNLDKSSIEHRIELAGHTGAAIRIATDYDEKVMAVLRGGLVSFYNAGLWTPLSQTAQPKRASAMAFDSSARTLFLNDDTKITRVQTSDGSPIVALEAAGLKPDDNWINVSGDGSAVLFMQQGELVSWDVASRSVRWRRAAVKAAYNGAGHPDGAIVVAVDEATKEPLLLDAATGETRRRLPWPEGMRKDDKLTVGRDGTIVTQSSPLEAESEWDHEFVVWRAGHDYAVKRIVATAEPFGLMLAISVSDDGSKVAAATFHGYMIADVESGVAREIKMKQTFGNNVSTIFTPDGKYLLAIALGLGSRVSRIDVAKGSAEPDLEVPTPGHGKQKISSFLVAPDGRSLVLAPYSWDGEPSTLMRLDLATGKMVDRYPGHANSVTALDQSADGRIAASLCDDRILRVWRMAD